MAKHKIWIYFIAALAGVGAGILFQPQFATLPVLNPIGATAVNLGAKLKTGS
jgi:hypothetical protein